MSSDSPFPNTFEEALSKLEQIVRSLDAGQSTLETSLKNYEQGVKLLRFCHEKLQNAERRIELLHRVNEDGSLQTKPVEEEEFSTKVNLSGQQTASDLPVMRRKRVRKTISREDGDSEGGPLFNDETD